jgi:hypothetical protein
MVLEFPAAVHPVDAGAMMPEAALQRLSDPAPQRVHLVQRQSVAAPEGVQPGAVQRFVDVNVAKAGKEGLVEQERLEHPAPPVEALSE